MRKDPELRGGCRLAHVWRLSEPVEHAWRRRKDGHSAALRGTRVAAGGAVIWCAASLEFETQKQKISRLVFAAQGPHQEFLRCWAPDSLTFCG